MRTVLFIGLMSIATSISGGNIPTVTPDVQRFFGYVLIGAIILDIIDIFK